VSKRRDGRFIRVSCLRPSFHVGHLRLGSLTFRCAIGPAGIRARKREGDGASPHGRHGLLRVLYRPDRVPRPRTGLPVKAIRRTDGWCDAPGDRNYNRPVRMPYPASAEELWRADGLYDIVVVVDYNVRQRRRGYGSAIFMHVADPAYGPTAGCVALRREHLTRLLAILPRGGRRLVFGG
jgi:L,D-peptidoglycan transpeptidase YkuD (ErfK/YbiS/YcfS/YnhG family)